MDIEALYNNLTAGSDAEREEAIAFMLEHKNVDRMIAEGRDEHFYFLKGYSNGSRLIAWYELREQGKTMTSGAGYYDLVDVADLEEHIEHCRKFIGENICSIPADVKTLDSLADRLTARLEAAIIAAADGEFTDAEAPKKLAQMHATNAIMHETLLESIQVQRSLERIIELVKQQRDELDAMLFARCDVIGEA